MFEDITQFPFVVELEKNWQVIRDEMVAVRNQGFIDWPEKSLLQVDAGWTTFGLYAFGYARNDDGWVLSTFTGQAYKAACRL